MLTYHRQAHLRQKKVSDIIPSKKLLIACGALAKEINTLITRNQWYTFDITCLPAHFHNYPDRIVPQIQKKISNAKLSGLYNEIIVVYGDCGTGGLLDKLLNKEKIKRISGNHCYEFYTGVTKFSNLAIEEIGTFYLSDYLVNFFDKLIIEGLGIQANPELRDVYFKNYKRLVYLAQTKNSVLEEKAEYAAKTLGLKYIYKYTGYGDLSAFLKSKIN